MGSMGGIGGDAWPRPVRPRIGARLSYALHHVLAANALTRRLTPAIERRPRVRSAFTAVERVSKERLFGCRMCGQCALPFTGYACPMTCPKQLRHGPCGGVGPHGECEVHPEQTCVWVIAHERAVATGHLDDLTRLHRPVDHRRWGESAWLNYWQGRDDDMATPPTAGGARPLLHRELGLVPR